MANVKKNKTSQIGNREYAYTDLAAINTFLETNGKTYDQYIETEQVGDKLLDRIMTQRYTIAEDGTLQKWGEPVKGLRLIYGPNETPQQLGSKVTYLRRYSLCMAFGIAAEDDDGAAASANPHGKSYPPKAQQQNAAAQKLENDGIPGKPPVKIDQAFLAKVRAKLPTINTNEELEAYWRRLNLNKQYQGYLQPSFKRRREEIANGME